jgi:hypothetical protein
VALLVEQSVKFLHDEVKSILTKLFFVFVSLENALKVLQIDIFCILYFRWFPVVSGVKNTVHFSASRYCPFFHYYFPIAKFQ